MKKVIILVVACVLCATMPAVAKPKSLWLLGDATAVDYSADSLSAYGWGKAFEQYTSPRYKLENVSTIGMSAKTFMESDLLQKMQRLRNRSIVILQFGANDLKEYSSKQYTQLDAFTRRLQEIIKLARENRINIVLCTPLAQPFYRNGELIDRYGGYAEAVRRVAEHNHLPVIDLEGSTKTWLLGMTEQEAAAYYVTLDADQLVGAEYQLNEAGANEVARMAKEAIQGGKSPKLKKVLKKD